MRKYIALGTSNQKNNVKDIANTLVVVMYFQKFPKPSDYSLAKEQQEKSIY